MNPIKRYNELDEKQIEWVKAWIIYVRLSAEIITPLLNSYEWSHVVCLSYTKVLSVIKKIMDIHVYYVQQIYVPRQLVGEVKPEIPVIADMPAINAWQPIQDIPADKVNPMQLDLPF